MSRSILVLPALIALPLPTQHRCRAAQATTETRIKWRGGMGRPRTKNTPRVTSKSLSIGIHVHGWGCANWRCGVEAIQKKGARKFVLGAESRRSTPCEATDKCMWSPPSPSSPTFEDACDRRSHGKGVVSLQISPCPWRSWRNEGSILLLPHDRGLLLSSSCYRANE